MPNLCLTRKPGEEIALGGEINVKVVSISGNRVRLRITAPETVSIHRAEVQRAIDRANRREAREALATERKERLTTSI